MSRDGFRIGDFDPHFPLDDKFMALAAVVPNRGVYFEATGVYWHVVAAAWRDGVRKSAVKVAPGASAECVKALQDAELLDGDTMIPAASFVTWVGAAKQRREESAERQRAWRHRNVGVTSANVSATARDGREVTTGQDRTGQDRRGGVGGKPQRGPDYCENPAAHRDRWIEPFEGVGLVCLECAPRDPLPELVLA